MGVFFKDQTAIFCFPVCVDHCHTGNTVSGECMSKYFHGTNRLGPYGEGWYFKCRTGDGKLLALIPALHIDDQGQRSVSCQVISDDAVCWLEYPAEAFSAEKDRFRIQIGDHVFSKNPYIFLRGREESTEPKVILNQAQSPLYLDQPIYSQVDISYWSCFPKIAVASP